MSKYIKTSKVIIASTVRDEVLAISEKVVLRVEDLITWITLDAEWTWGKLGKICIQDANEDEIRHFLSFSESSLDFSDVEKERKSLGKYNSSIPTFL
ncbi:hypothetical protein QE152_g1021 [Popillia japonica]|uniref:Uncharacterized protein n=1 Tax=Popillia japonica TaxID=7064 RepID=A0AAW1NA54_POPJA